MHRSYCFVQSTENSLLKNKWTQLLKHQIIALEFCPDKTSMISHRICQKPELGLRNREDLYNFISKLLVLTFKALINQILALQRNSCFLPPVNWKSGRALKDLRFINGTHFYRPQRSWAKVMFLHVSVILFTGGLPQGMLGYHPPGAVHAWRYMGNKRAVRILLECILVNHENKSLLFCI